MTVRLGLGTAQFGLDYGVTNCGGVLDLEDVRDVLQSALDAGISLFDTAPAYGDSEAKLGQLIPKTREVSVITKTPTFTNVAKITDVDRTLLLSVFETSLGALDRSSVYGLLVHSAAVLCRPGAERLIESLEQLRSDGRVEKLGVSVYTAEDIEHVLSIWTPDFVQLPLSIADQRLLKSGHVADLKANAVEIHARSIFLQGVLLAPASELPKFLAPATAQFSKIEMGIGEASKLEACLGFILQATGVDVAIFGVTSLKQLRDILDAQRAACGLDLDYAELAIDEERYVDPRGWPVTQEQAGIG